MRHFYQWVTVAAFFLFSVKVFAEEPTPVPAPDFLSWKYCFGEISTKKDQSEKSLPEKDRPDITGKIWRITCFDKEKVQFADNMVVRFSDKDKEQDGALLLWFIFERSRDNFSVVDQNKVYRIDKFKIHLYRSKLNQEGRMDWVWLEYKELLRSSSNEGLKLDIVEPSSPFGKAYLEFMIKMGRDPANIKMPSIKFDK